MSDHQATNNPRRIAPQAEDFLKDREQKLGRELINNLFVLLKTAYVHEQNNAAVIPPLESVQRTVRSLLADSQGDAVSLKLVSNAFFLNSTLIRMDQATFQNADFLKVICEEIDVGEWEFQDGCGEGEFRALMKAVIDAVRSSENVIQRDLGTVQLKPRSEAAESKLVVGKKQSMLQVYASAMAFAASAVAFWAQGRRLQLSSAKRVVQRMVGAVEEDPLTLLGLTSLPGYKAHLASHFVNVSIVSLVLGRRVGFDKRDLVRVGLTAFLHELGSILLPDDAINACGPLEDAQYRELGKLPLLSVCCLADSAGGRAENLARMVSVYENRAHIPAGRPYRVPMVPDVFSELVSAADAYDHLTATRMGHAALAPHRALEQMLDARDEKFPRWSVGLLVREIGFPPIGSVVELDSGEVGIVMGGPAYSSTQDFPIIRLVADRAGQPIAGPVFVNEPGNNSPDKRLRTIRRILSPADQNVNVSQVFLD